MRTVDIDTKEALERARKRVNKLSESLGRTPTAAVVTFGCQMNARDSEKLEGILESAGFDISNDEESDFLIFNTCTVRENADNRLFGRLGRISALKRSHPWMKLAVCGCMMQETVNVERIKKSYPFVDLIFGTYNIFTFPSLLDAVYADENTGNMLVDIWDGTDRIVEDLPIRRKYAFKSGVNIMFGCNNFCSYCIVPYVRGRERSRKPEEILSEIRDLVSDGVKEVMLLGQNVNSYGKGLSEETNFPKLLRAVGEIEGLSRIRFISSHPKDLSDDLIKAMAENEKICRHLHLAVQSGSDRVLELMNRHYTKDAYLRIIDKLKNAMPDIAVTTDIIVGFPGEKREDIEETIDLINRAEFDGAFTFIYSKRTGTAAAGFEQLLTEEEIHDGFDRVLSVVQENAKKRIKRFVGQRAKVLIECVNEKDSEYLSGRLSQNTMVHFKGPETLIGEIREVDLKEERGFYYMADLCTQ